MPATTGFPAEEKCANCAFWRRHHLGVTLKCPVSEPPFTTFEAQLACDECTDRAPCPRHAPKSTRLSEDESDRVMLLVWEQWAKKEGNDGAAKLFRDVAERLAVDERRLAPLVALVDMIDQMCRELNDPFWTDAQHAVWDAAWKARKGGAA